MKPVILAGLAAGVQIVLAGKGKTRGTSREGQTLPWLHLAGEGNAPNPSGCAKM